MNLSAFNLVAATALTALSAFAPGCKPGDANRQSLQSPAASETPDSLSSANPDQEEMLSLLQGAWQNEQDSTDLLVFNGAKMRHIRDSTAVTEKEIDIDASCSNTACNPARGSAGWCFTELSDFDAQCNLVVRCDSALLQFSPVGVENATRSYKKKK